MLSNLASDPILQALMAQNRGPASGQPLQPQGGSQISSVVQQALADQMRGQQIKAQIMQTLGFGQNPMPMGAIPQGAGISIMDGQAMTRPGGMPQQTSQLLSALFGLGQGGTRGMQQPNTGTFQMERPGGVMQAEGNNDPAFVQNRLETALAGKDQMLIDFLLRNYAEMIKGATPPQNSGMMQGSRF
jgi:hypothetical protein